MKAHPHPTPQQSVIIEHLVRGLTYKEIGNAIGRSKKTVQNHAEALHKRIGIYTQTGIVSWYWRKRVAELEARIASLEGGSK